MKEPEEDMYHLTTRWNPWHGCRRVSTGCENCYMFEGDSRRGVPGSDVVRRSRTHFDLPIQRGANGAYKVREGLVMTALTSDFFIEDADEWRDEAWNMISKRRDLTFLILTKRPQRIGVCLPEDWGSGYENVRLSVSVEDQRSWDERVPILRSIPSRKRDVFVAPMIGPISAGKELCQGDMDAVYVGGEWSRNARVCDYDWVKSLREECVANGVTFIWRHCGSRFRKDGEEFLVENIVDQSKLSRSMNMNHIADPILLPKRTFQSKLF